jgi:hypothetical protein
MAFTNQTTHYGLPQWIGSDKPTYLVDQNNAYQTIDSEIYNANVAAGEAVTTANGASSTAGAASATAADALSAAQTASTTADSALTAAQDAGTIAQAAQTAAGAAQTAAEAAQTAAAGNSITNLAPAYDSTITYAIDDLVTQDGKLYKCIVAVVTPEQFDINKWDDVTTSEVYARVGSGDVYTKAEADAKFETQTHASNTYETITNVTNKNNLKLAVNGGGAAIRFGIDGNGNYGYVKDGADTVYPFSSGFNPSNVEGNVINSTSPVTLNTSGKHYVLITLIYYSIPGVESSVNMSNLTGATSTVVSKSIIDGIVSKTYLLNITANSVSFTLTNPGGFYPQVVVTYID